MHVHVHSEFLHPMAENIAYVNQNGNLTFFDSSGAEELLKVIAPEYLKRADDAFKAVTQRNENLNDKVQELYAEIADKDAHIEAFKHRVRVLSNELIKFAGAYTAAQYNKLAHELDRHLVKSSSEMDELKKLNASQAKEIQDLVVENKALRERRTITRADLENAQECGMQAYQTALNNSLFMGFGIETATDEQFKAAMAQTNKRHEGAYKKLADR